VIAREWKYLDPVRAYCEVRGIPAYMAHDEAPGFWRLRETQALLDWLRGTEHELVSAGAISEWVGAQTKNPWVTLLQEAASEYELETGGAELPKAHFIEWLAEWGREVRRRQSGLLLLTAHRAKGLEFDHVAVLDGGWQKVDKGEDPDAPRRLLYVAMTRARHTLCLGRFDARHALLDSLPESPAILRRAASQLPAPPSELARQYVRLNLGQVDLGFAGRSESGAPVHRAIANLTTGAALQLKVERDKFVLKDQNGNTVGRLAAAYAAPAGTQCISVQVAAIIVRYKSDSEPEYQRLARCERWEVVVPEVVYAPQI
jgi:ATP-dependent DNA helicase RecQ